MTAESLLIWLLVGLIAGWLAAVVVRGGGYGIVGDIVIGIVGALIGGLLFGVLGLHVPVASRLLADIIVAFIGAVILIVILRAVSPTRSRL